MRGNTIPFPLIVIHMLPPKLFMMCVLALLGSGLILGCAKHADFVNLRKDLRSGLESQEQHQQEAAREREAIFRRLQALEMTEESGGNGRTLGELSFQLKTFEERLARLEQERTEPQKFPSLSRGRVEDLPEPPIPVPESPPTPRAAISPLGLGPGMTPSSAFNLAYNDYLNGRYDLSIVGFKSFLNDYPHASLAGNALYWLGESYYRQRDYVRARQMFERVVMEHPSHGKVPGALYRIGLAAAETGDRAGARKYLTRVIEEYSTSKEAILAKNKLAELR